VCGIVRSTNDKRVITAAGRLPEHDHVIETLAKRGSNEALDEGILPRRARCREYLLDPNCLCGGSETLECVIAIVNQVLTRLAPRKASHSCWAVHAGVRGDCDVPDASAIVDEHHQTRTTGGRSPSARRRNRPTIWPL
jgi:hypothetical protein